MGIGLLDCNAGPGCLLDGVGWGFAGQDPLVSSSLGSNSLELADRMGRWPGYGDLVWRMGEWPACGDLAKRMGRWPAMGEPRNLWENGLCGRPQNRMGSSENVWEMPQDMGNGAGTWGGRQAVWGAKIALKPEIWERWRPAGLHVFMNFWREAAAWHSLPSELRTGPAANIAAPKIPRLRHLALASS